MEEKKEVKLVPAVCTQCGATLEVDPAQEVAVCKFCNTQFIVEKAINNYNVKFANIEHADNVNIDLRGTVKEVLGFAGEQMAANRAERKQLRSMEKEQERQFMKNFFKMFFLFAAAMMIIWIIANFLGAFD